MIQTLTRNWSLLALRGILDASLAVIYLVMQGTDGPVTFHSWGSTIRLAGKLALLAGAFTIGAGVWRARKGKCWPLVLNGLALGALGLIQAAFVRYRISFHIVVLLIILMAMSTGVLALVTARALRRQRHVANGPLWGAAGAVSVGFAAAFLALGIGWIKIEPGSHADLLWLGCYFGFSAIYMMGLALRLRGERELGAVNY